MTTIHHAANVQGTEDRHGLTVRVLGDITSRNSGEICEAIQDEWQSHGKPRRLILDLHDVQHIDSSGVGALMEIQQKATQSNVRLALCGLQDGPRRLLERTGISRLFEIREGREDAVPLLPASRTRHDRIVEEQPKPKRRHRMLWTLLCLCVVVGAMTAIGTSAYPALQNYHAQLEQVPVLSGLLHGVDDRVQAVEQSLKDRFGNLETRLNGHLRNERLQRQRLQTEMDRRTAELSSRLEAVESAQRATDARITDLQQQVDQTKEGPQQ